MVFSSEALNGAVLFFEDLVLHREEAAQRLGDKDLYLEIAHYFSSHLEESLKDLGAALSSADALTAVRLAHSLKGNCATVGADVLREHCKTLENLCREGKLDSARSLYESLVPKLLVLRDVLISL
jgi:HPt (histidine-containing phosphotransfer) domain-containing protein